MEETKSLISVLFLLLCVNTMAAQDADMPTNKELRKVRPNYISIGMGLNRGNVRDFATSPLIYKGLLLNYSLGYQRYDDMRDTRLNIRFNHGGYKYKKQVAIPLVSRTAVYALFVNYAKLYRLKKYSNSKWNLKVGGMLDVVTDTRVNPELQNAGVGYEVFNTLFASGKVTRTFVRHEMKEKKLWFIKYKLKPRVLQVSYQLNLPVVNGYARNGFAYLGNERIGEIPLFNGYQYKLFSGFRISSDLAVTRQMANGNMWRISYIWDAYTTGGSQNRFEMANHIAEFSLLFHLNKNKQS